MQEVIGYYLRNGSHPIVTVLDCSKAFDTCRFSTLFEKLIGTGLPPVIIRALMTMYQQQYAWVRWGQAVSSRFPISNGTRQGSMASPALWSVYLDLLIKELRQLGVGCHVAGMYMGVMVYADDVLLIAPTRSAMQVMLNQCQDYANRHNIMFSTDPVPHKSKTKCIFIIGTKKNLVRPDPLTLCGRELPWVTTATHLGHELHESGTMEHDAEVKRAAFISSSMDVRETFRFASPVEVLTALKVYCTSFSGCMLWDLGGEGARKVFNSWTTAIKLVWNVPRATRTFLVQNVLSSGLSSARVDILARYGGFLRSLRKSPCQEVSVMVNIAARDLRSTTGKNKRILVDCSGVDPWEFGSSRLKEELSKNELVTILDRDSWRVRYLANLLEQRQHGHYQAFEGEVERLSELINSLCIN